jgi:hypothetical protein
VNDTPLTDTELKQCYAGCGSGLRENTWASCGGDDGFTVTGAAASIFGTANVLDPSPARFSATGPEGDGRANRLSCKTITLRDKIRRVGIASIVLIVAGFHLTLVFRAVVENKEGLNPQPVTFADFIQGLRECSMSGMKGCSC